MTVTSRLETPVFFPAGGEDIFGVFTRPEVEPNGMAVLALFTAGPFPALGKNQVWVRMSRELAGLGFHVLRIDYGGIGESSGEAREPSLSNLWTDEAVGAARWLQQQGFDRVLVVGACLGARTAVAAFSQMPNVAGMFLNAPPVGEADHGETIAAQPLSWYVKRAMSPTSVRLVVGRNPKARRRREILRARVRRAVGRGGEGAVVERPKQAHASPAFLKPMAEVLKSGTPVMLLYGRRDDFFSNFEESLDGRLGELIDAAGPAVTVRIIDETTAGLASSETQRMFLQEVTEFAAGVAERSAAQFVPVREERSGLQLD